MKWITLLYVVIIHLFLSFIIIASLSAAAPSPEQLIMELGLGFSATPDESVTTFQPLLSDSTGNFSLGFLRLNHHQLALAVVHVASAESFWQPNSLLLAHWGKHTRLFFNGSLVFTDPKSGILWSSNTNSRKGGISGDRVVLTSASNLQILKAKGDSDSHSRSRSRSRSIIVWQSFDFPSDTLVENQNFTSATSLVSSNALYTMRLGFDFFGLYANFNPLSGLGHIYFKHRALEAKAEIVPGHGPIVLRISSDGFMGMYQNGSVIPADVETFNSYQRSVPGPRRIRIERDGNLKGYYWSGSSWNLDYVAITEPCELPSPCGPYGLCTPGHGCSCLDNQTQTQTHECRESRFVPGPGDLCGGSKGRSNKYTELRRRGVEVGFKELMKYTKTASYERCEESCEMDCKCWGALYNNVSGLCYKVECPIQSMIGVGGTGDDYDSKMGYFKVWEGNVAKKRGRWVVGIGVGFLCVSIFFLLGVVGLACWKLCKRKKNHGFLEDEDNVCSRPYKDLGSSSFGSIQLTNK